VRKEAKAHGTGSVSRPVQERDRVAIIEDVITSGQSAAEAIRVVRAAGGVIVGVLALLDRERVVERPLSTGRADREPRDSFRTQGFSDCRAMTPHDARSGLVQE